MAVEDEYNPRPTARLEKLGGRPLEIGAPGDGESSAHGENALSFVATLERAFANGPRMVDLLAELAEDRALEPRDRIRAAQIVIEQATKQAGKDAADGGEAELSALERLAAAAVKAKDE
jgi:hypothetical protein